jgi:Protein of unknown function (DUF4019)
MRKLLIGLCLLLFLTVPSLADNTEDQILAAAISFAELVADGNFQAAYWSGAPLLQSANAEQEWLDHTERSQKVLGRVLTRDLKTTRAITSLASFPDDNYQVILFSTRTEYKAKAYETLLLHQVDGSWQVCSYKIH